MDLDGPLLLCEYLFGVFTAPLYFWGPTNPLLVNIRSCLLICGCGADAELLEDACSVSPFEGVLDAICLTLLSMHQWTVHTTSNGILA